MISRTLKPIKPADVKTPGLYLFHPVVAFTDQPLMLVEVKRKTYRKTGNSYLIYCQSPNDERVVKGCGGVFFKLPNIKIREKKKPKLTNEELNGGWKQGYANTDSMA